MSRPLRIHVPGAMYHVTLRGNHQHDIFFTLTDRTRMSELFGEVLDRFSARLHAYCYMTNHLHALIQVGDVPLGNLILRIAGKYARMTQARMETSGHLFEKRYHPVLVDTDEYLLTVLRYIHLNPVRARLVRRLEDYAWSSHHAYLGLRSEPWVTTEFALRQFHSELARARRAYRQFIREGLDVVATPSPFESCNPNDSRILGSDDFAGRLFGNEWRPRSRKTLDDLVKEACARYSVAPMDLASRSRRENLVAARAWVAHEAVIHRIASIAEVARQFGRDESSLRHALNTRYPSGGVIPVSRPGTI